MGLSSTVSSLRRSLPPPGSTGRWRLVARTEENRERIRVGAEKQRGYSVGHCTALLRHRAVGQGRDIHASVSLLHCSAAVLTMLGPHLAFSPG